MLQAVCQYLRFSLSFRDVWGLMTQRGIDVTEKTIRRWSIAFGPVIARRLKRRRPSPSPRWHSDKVVCQIGGRLVELWRIADDQGEFHEHRVSLPGQDPCRALRLGVPARRQGRLEIAAMLDLKRLPAPQDRLGAVLVLLDMKPSMRSPACGGVAVR